MNLVERTTALVPMLRQHAAAAENERRVPLATLEALDQAGVFRMMAPKKFGGDEADFETQARVLAEIGSRMSLDLVGRDHLQRDGLGRQRLPGPGAG